MVLLLVAFLVAADQLSKAWVTRNLPLDQVDIPVFPGLGITYTRNDGAAFGMLRDIDFTVLGYHLDGTRMLGLLSGVVGVAIGVYLITRGRDLLALQRVSLALVMGGALGNMIDRLRLGYVVDFIHVRSGGFSFPVFNVADACVVVGAGLLLISGMRGPHARSDDEGGQEERDHTYDTSEEDEVVAYVARPSPSHPKTGRPRKVPLEELPELPPLGRATEAD
jgi:signal peptidase II